MKQTAHIISVYAADVSGVCSALFELGGMTIMHDASGCNSTYNTHDEPRWYDSDSMVYISALTETEAILGEDSKLIGDIVSAAKELHPAFIAIAGSPIPMMIGTDFKAIAAMVEQQTGIPSFGIPTNGMHSYISGVSLALAALTDRFVKPQTCRAKELSVNILGATPLDFSVGGSVDSLKNILIQNGVSVNSCFAMGSSLDEIGKAACAQVNLVVSASGIKAAELLQSRFAIPYVAGIPVGSEFTRQLIEAIKTAAAQKVNLTPFLERNTAANAPIVLIGEGVQCGSVAAALTLETGLTARVICPLEDSYNLLTTGDTAAMDEDELIPLLSGAQVIIADPLYHPICPKTAHFIPLAHEAFSGRLYRKSIPNLIEDFTILKKEVPLL